MVYASQETNNWRLSIQTWLDQLDPERFSEKARDILSSIFENRIDLCFEHFERYNFKEPITTVRNNVIKSMLNILQILTDEESGIDITIQEVDALKKTFK
jgi:hypothetical protein